MTFTDALALVFDSHSRIARHTWNNRSIYCLLHEEKLCIKGFASGGQDDGLPHPWVITSEDYYATDWEVVE